MLEWMQETLLLNQNMYLLTYISFNLNVSEWLKIMTFVRQQYLDIITLKYLLSSVSRVVASTGSTESIKLVKFWKRRSIESVKLPR